MNKTMISKKKKLGVELPFGFTPRPYQVPLFQAMDSGYKRAVIVWHRRSGKEKTCVNIVSKKMQERIGSYYYVFPEFNQGRKTLWDGADKQGFRFLDHFPRQLMKGAPNNTEMKLRYKNGSLFQIIGSDSFDAVMGTNPIGMVFAEYSLQDPSCWNYFRPILAENEGFAIFDFTPRGENHAFDLFNLAKENPSEWFSQLLTVKDTQAIDPKVLEQEHREIVRLNGNDAIYQQEYHCSFTVPISGAYYADHLIKAYEEGRIGNVRHDPHFLVDTWWDLGINDRMSVWYTQSVGSELRVIDYDEAIGVSLIDWIKSVRDKKDYQYGTHTGPHDIRVRELTSGKSRFDTAAGLQFHFQVAPNIPVVDGIDAARSMFPRCWFDEKKCALGINALKNYIKKYNPITKAYGNTPLHNWASNAADAFRYLAVGLDFQQSKRPMPVDAYERQEHRSYNPMTV